MFTVNGVVFDPAASTQVLRLAHPILLNVTLLPMQQHATRLGSLSPRSSPSRGHRPPANGAPRERRDHPRARVRIAKELRPGIVHHGGDEAYPAHHSLGHPAIAPAALSARIDGAERHGTPHALSRTHAPGCFAGHTGDHGRARREGRDVCTQLAQFRRATSNDLPQPEELERSDCDGEGVLDHR